MTASEIRQDLDQRIAAVEHLGEDPAAVKERLEAAREAIRSVGSKFGLLATRAETAGKKLCAAILDPCCAGHGHCEEVTRNLAVEAFVPYLLGLHHAASKRDSVANVALHHPADKMHSLALTFLESFDAEAAHVEANVAKLEALAESAA